MSFLGKPPGDQGGKWNTPGATATGDHGAFQQFALPVQWDLATLVTQSCGGQSVVQS